MEPIYILKSSSEIQEALWIANWIKNEITNDRLNPKEIVIICRDIELAKEVVTELKKRNIVNHLGLTRIFLYNKSHYTQHGSNKNTEKWE